MGSVRKCAALITVAVLLSNSTVWAAENEQAPLTFRKKITSVVDKNAKETQLEELEKNRKTGIMPYFVEADEFAKKKDYKSAASKLDEAAKVYPADYPPLVRWRSIYHTHAGNWNDVIFLLKDRKRDIVADWCLARCYRQLGYYDKAKEILDEADVLIPNEFKVPKVPPEIPSFDNLEKNAPWLAAMLVYGEKAILSYTVLNDSKNAGSVFEAIGNFGNSVPLEADMRVLPFDNIYGLDMSDMALVAGFTFLAEKEDKDAKELFNWYVKRKTPISPLDKRFIDECKVYLGESDPKK